MAISFARLIGLTLVLPILGTTGAGAETRRITIEACAMCHGEEGIARDGEVPNLAGQNERYLYNQMLAFRSGQRKHQEMRIMTREMTVDDIAAMAAYYASLPPR